MSVDLKTIATTANVDENGFLHGIEPLREIKGTQVQVLVLVRSMRNADYDLDDPTDEEWRRALTLWNAELEDEPDLYTRESGKPFDASQYT